MKTSVVDDILDCLVKDVSSGTLAPGTKLEEQAVADRFSVSRTPVREALRHLAAMGLVENRGRRGVWVSEVTVEELSQMFEAMGEIEALCARLAAQRMTPFERKTLEDVHVKCFEHVKNNDLQSYVEANNKFHHVIYRGTHNKFVEDLATHFRDRTAPFRNRQFKNQANLRSSFESHARIVEAIAQNRPDDAFLDMRAHSTDSHLSIINQEMLQRLK